MSKRFISALLMAVFFVTATSVFTSCKDYDDDISKLQSQIDQNTKAIEQINSLISNGSVIRSVVSVSDGIKITLSDGNEYTITNGAKGQDADVWTISSDGYWEKNGVKTSYKAVGTNGTNGTTPTISISSDGYWVINGVKSTVKAQGADGENGTTPTISISSDGYWVINGVKSTVKAQGADGADGEDGCYYVPNAETGKFDIYNADGTFKESTDISWLAPVQSLGYITAVLDNNQLKLYGVNGSAEPIIIDRTNELQSLVFIPEVYDGGVPAIVVTSLSYNALTLQSKDSKNETAKKSTVLSYSTPTTYAQYHVNPANANVEDLKNIKFVVKANDSYRKRARATSDFNAKAEFFKFEDGILTVKVDVTGAPATADLISVVALQSTKRDEGIVTSDYASIVKDEIGDLAIADKVRHEQSPSVDYHFRSLINGIDTNASNAKRVWEDYEDVVGGTCDVEMAYNSTLDVMALLEAHNYKNTPCTVADLVALGMNFKVELVKNYKIGSSSTDQAEFVTLTDGVLQVKDIYKEAAIDRTPIIRVSLLHGSNLVKVAYIKVKIVRPASPTPEPLGYTLTMPDFTFACSKDGVVINEYKQMNQEIYAVLHLSKTEFHKRYSIFEDSPATGDVGTVAEVTVSDDVAEGTHRLQWTITNQELWDHAGQQVTNMVRYKSAGGTYVDIKLTAKIGGVKKDYALTSANFIKAYWNDDYSATRFNVNVKSSPSDANPANCIYDIDLNAPFVCNASGIIDLDAAITLIEYEFCKDMNGKKLKGQSGTEYTFSVSTDGKTLSAGGQTIASIAGMNFSYAKSSSVAKDLVNSDNMYVLITIKGYACSDKNKPVKISLNGQDHFRANIVKPIKIATTSASPFKDGVDYGEAGSYIKVEDLINPKDWRGRNFVASDWGFYGPFTVKFDKTNRADAETDINGSYAPLYTTKLELDQVATIAGATSTYGFLTYKNNGVVVNNDFHIRVKVTVDYGWGTIKSEWIEIPVKATVLGAPSKSRKK